jgi:drug/metabolite transporter (DMT)-like permease
MLSKITAGLSRVLHGAEHHRAYVYRVAVTVGALLVGGGYLTAGRESAALTLLGAVLGLGGSGLAAANTSTKKRTEAGAVDPGSLALGVVAGAVVAYLILR